MFTPVRARSAASLAFVGLLGFLAVASGSLGCSSGSGGAGSGGNGSGGTTVASSGGSTPGSGGTTSGSGGATTGSGGSSPGTGGSGTGSGGATAEAKFAPCSSDKRLGGFTLSLVHETAASGTNSGTPAHAQFGGSVYDRVKPDTVWPEIQHDGDCRVVVGPAFSCPNGCASGQVCAGDNVCQPASKAQSAGVVNVTGLTAALTSSPSKSNIYYETFSSDAAYPPFTVGATINLAAAGDAVPAINLAARGIAPLDLPASQTLMLSSGKSLALAWAPPPSNGAGRITVSMDIGHHNGMTAAHLDCDFPDTGSATIPAGLITTLMSKGYAGYPDLEIARASVDSTTTSAGCVEWLVTAPLKVPLAIEGVTSCHEDTDCPTAAPVCHADLTCGT
jgi:hypothetical protein